jgi:indolepyruvate ferredoxin oxidoreductase alpha subunit
VYNKARITVVIADNRTTAMTGQQDNPGTGQTLMGEATHRLDFEGLARAVGVEHVATLDPMALESAEETLRQAMAHPGPSVVVARRACVFVDRKQYAGPVAVEAEKCTRCRMCIRLGCPAISLGEDSAVVDPMLCAGCELCAEVCPQDAFLRAPAREEV